MPAGVAYLRGMRMRENSRVALRGVTFVAVHWAGSAR